MLVSYHKFDTVVFSISESIIDQYRDSHSMELQQRAVEYTALFLKHDNLRPGVLERMPQFEKILKSETGDQEDEEIPKKSDVVAPAMVQPDNKVVFLHSVLFIIV